MTDPLALIIDDEPDIRELLELTLGRMDINTQAAKDVAQAKELLGQQSFDLCLTDMRLPDGNGIDLVKYIQHSYPETPVAVITAHGNMELAIEALKSGAFDFVSKPVDLQILRKLVNTALKLSDAKQEAPKDSSKTLLGDSDVMQQVRATIDKLARNQAPVHISGPSGSGKELVARLIHENGPRGDKSFVPVNCGAIPEDLMESEFFGHNKGSFTGAVADKQGLFQAADGGTLFLDEVADLPLHMQVKLLRAIQEKSIRPIGEQKEFPIDVRILSATNENLAELVKKGEFRQDLYYRINVIQLDVPSLHQRLEDIPILATHILERLAAQSDFHCPELSKDALQSLKDYPFPGNVRELENILERAMTLCEGSVIQKDELQLPKITEETRLLDPESPELPLESHLDSIERDTIQKALEKTKYNKTAAAKLLGISFRALRYRLKKLGMD